MSPRQSAVPYRADIDGLRAIAVSLVVLHHLDASFLTGGYVGVDVFFVISGFLITGFIVGDLNSGRFDLLRFYERRARRILPALLAVLAATTLAALLILPPEELRDFAASVPAALFMVANLHMKSLGGYFGADMHTVPLLHLWSIAVEEQFYLVYPVLLWGLHRWRPRFVPHIIVFTLVLAFAWAAYHAARSPAAAYFATPDRAWELLLGAASWFAVPIIARHVNGFGAMAALIGLAVIGTSAVFAGAESGFPGLPALAPCLGAAMVLLGGAGRPSPLLSIQPLVTLGKLSYSLYLWHWPILVLAAVVVPTPSWPYRLGLIAAMFGAAGLSYRFVEMPCRRSPPDGEQRRFAIGLAAATAPIVLIAAVNIVWPAWTQIVPPDTAARLAELRTDKANVAACRVVSRAGLIAPCQFGAATAPAPLYVVGDSHAGSLALGLTGGATRSVRVDTVPTCPPFGGAAPDVRGVSSGRSCRIRNASLPARIAEDPSISTVVLAAHWLTYRDHTATDAAPTYDRIIRHAADLATALTAAGKTVIILGPTPEQDSDVALAYGRAAAGWPARLTTVRTGIDRRHKDVRAAFLALEALPGVAVVYPDRALCNATICFGASSDEPYYFDSGHLSGRGARQLAPLIEAAARDLAERRADTTARRAAL